MCIKEPILTSLHSSILAGLSGSSNTPQEFWRPLFRTRSFAIVELSVGNLKGDVRIGARREDIFSAGLLGCDDRHIVGLWGVVPASAAVFTTDDSTLVGVIFGCDC
jgi:hypothetical protein